jgi:hypothetical protein
VIRCLIGNITLYTRSVLLKKYHSGDQIKKTEMGRVCSAYWGDETAYRVLVGKPEGRRLLERRRHR